MTQPIIGDREFRNSIIRLADLTVREPRLDGYTFVNCQVIGPAVLAIGENVTLAHCHFEADVNAIFWVVDPAERPLVFGAIGLNNVTFSACTFQAVGFAGTAELRDLMSGAVSG